MAVRTTPAELIHVDETWLPGITKYTLTLEDIDAESTSRDEAGYMHRELVRGKVIHGQIEHIVDGEELQTICSLISDDSTVEMTVFCPARGTQNDPNVTSDFYVSKFDFDLIRLKDPATGEVADWWRLSYTIVEV